MFRAILFASSLALAGPALANPAAPNDEAALRALATDADRAWNQRDPAAMLAVYADGSSLRVGMEAAQLSGRESIGRFFAAAFARREGEFRHLTEFDGIDMVDPKHALSEGTVRVEQRGANGDWVLARRFRSMSLAVRTAEGWKLRWVRAIPLP